jgi:glycosyltransferase involved in cell wall biosynthesis
LSVPSTANGERILHLVHTPRHSGAETIVRELCLIHQRQGIATAIASFNPSEASFANSVQRLTGSGVRLFFPDRHLAAMQRVRFYQSAYREFIPSLIYGHSVLPALYGRLALFSSNVPDRKFIPVLHSATNDDYSELKLWASELLLARLANRVFAVSAEGARSYTKRIPHHKPVRVVANGSDLSQIRSASVDRDRHREAMGLALSQRMILQVGRLSPVKQQLLSFKALIPLLNASKHIQLWFAGLTEDSAYEFELRNSIESAGLQSQVKVLGSREDVMALLAAADVFIMPSLAESQGVALIEALASGAPVVASNISQFEYAASMPGVLLVRPTDEAALRTAVTSLLNDSRRFQRELNNLDIRDVADIYSSYLRN